jgi:hypothetical protein
MELFNHKREVYVQLRMNVKLTWNRKCGIVFLKLLFLYVRAKETK